MPAPAASVVQVELRSVQNGPENVSECFVFFTGGLAPVDERNQDRQLFRPWPAGQGGEVKGFDPARRIKERGLDDRGQGLAVLGVGGAVDKSSVHHRECLDDRRLGFD